MKYRKLHELSRVTDINGVLLTYNWECKTMSFQIWISKIASGKPVREGVHA